MNELKIEKGMYENQQLEFKTAKGGFPKSFWETYSAFSNTRGGIVYLGISELPDKTIISSLLNSKDIISLKNELWSSLNNPQKVSVNLISENDIKVKEYDGYPVLEIKIKPASNEYKPVYINGNILTGSYRRNFEGDYHCSPSEIKAMLRDADEKTQDLKPVEELDLDSLCKETISAYKNRLLALHPEHVFAQKDETSFLEYLGAIRMCSDKSMHPTRAGLLMFGYAHKIVYEFPEYFIDYQEIYSDDVRWTDRVTSESGDWSGNLFDFYNKIINRLTSDVKNEFTMNNVTRLDDNMMHKALREALCNAISNSDFLFPRGLVIKKYKDHIEFNNPGCLRMSVEQMFKGGESDARNKTILKMFNLVGVGERAGSVVPLILNACSKFHLPTPMLSDEFNPDRTKLVISLVDNIKVKTDVKKEQGVSEDKIERQILGYLNSNDNSKVKDIASALSLSVSTIKKKIYSLVDLGKVVSSGSVKDKRYSIAK